MIKYGSDELYIVLARLYNDMLDQRRIIDDWRDTVSRMIPKSGDLTLSVNHRPIAILLILYQQSSRMLY